VSRFDEETFARDLTNWRGMFEESERRTFERIDREVMREIGELKKALAEFDSYRHVWSEIAANNVPPGRDSDFKRRLEVMQGKALRALDGAAWRLRVKIRGEVDAPNAEAVPRRGSDVGTSPLLGKEVGMDKHWCMCTKLQAVARDGWSTCSICGGKDAYGKSKDRPRNKRKTVELPNAEREVRT